MEKSNDTPNYHLGHRERLRKKFDADNELTAFEEHEVLEYLLSLVIPRKDTNGLAHEMIAKMGSLHNVFMSNPRELKEFKNMTNSAAYLIAAIYPSIRKSLRTIDTYGPDGEFAKVQDIVEHLQPKFIGRKNECLAIMYLNHNYKLLREEWEEGEYPERVGVDSTSILKRAVKEGASYVVFAHNHPSQDLSPSKEDIIETAKMFADFASLSITLKDSIIFSDTSFLSFRRMGLMDNCEREYVNALSNPNNMQSSRYYSTEKFNTNLIENLIDYDLLRKSGDFIAKENPESLTPNAKKDPRYKREK